MKIQNNQLILHTGLAVSDSKIEPDLCNIQWLCNLISVMGSLPSERWTVFARLSDFSVKVVFWRHSGYPILHQSVEISNLLQIMRKFFNFLTLSGPTDSLVWSHVRWDFYLFFFLFLTKDEKWQKGESPHCAAIENWTLKIGGRPSLISP